MPGHEIVGRVAKAGSGLTKFKSGDLVGVGCMVDSDGTCDDRKAGLERFCAKRVGTYGGDLTSASAPAIGMT